ncbi:MAG: hypothetical protein H7Z19_06535 [Chitinophagaceae bacterium]|nr:hypothetical protein [Rubrivivax sp.]
MSSEGDPILGHLRAVAAEREAQGRDPALAARVVAVKKFQHQRFESTYADMLAHGRYGRAARFFLDDLYGPHDFSERDDQFARIVPALVRLFPAEIVQTVALLAELHALSETLDAAMARNLPDASVTWANYGVAWRAVGRPQDRERQIELLLQVGLALDRLTRRALLRHSLRLMRGPAQAAGLGSLQRFLETGFDTFREMNGAQGFLDTIATRERQLAARLFSAAEAAGAPNL